MKTRLRAALPAALTHLLASSMVAILAALLVFLVWFPSPFGELLGGRDLFVLLISVDVVCGPLLTLIVFNRAKPKSELWRDIGVIVVLQICALLFGLWSIMQARPVYVAFEMDRFRVVRVPDIDPAKLAAAPESLRRFSLTGPKLLGVKSIKPGGAGFEESVRLSLLDEYPAYRPGEWVPFAQQREAMLGAAKDISSLKERNPERLGVLAEFLLKSGFRESQLGYLPLVAGEHDDWVAVIDVKSAEVVGYLPLIGW